MSGRKRKSYTSEYRRDAAQLVIDAGRPIATIAGEIGVGEQLLGRWWRSNGRALMTPAGRV
jgi:transposase